MIDQFLRRKKQQFLKNDRSLKQSWDKHILELCETINKKDNYYTTSSCSGRILMLISSKLIAEINKIKDKRMIYFKYDPCILHIACRNLEKAQNLLDTAKKAGWKRCGIITIGKRIILELNSTEKLEFPLLNKRELLVDDKFLKLVIEISNRNLKLSWDKISRLNILFRAQ
jgi:tRNA wybutosine-synthesizing protein 3